MRQGFLRMTIIGLGLIGSSIARAADERKLAETIIGYDSDATSLAYAKREGFIDIATSSLQEAVKNSELIILATPPSTLGEIAAAIAPHLQKNAIVMDVASVKQPAIDAIAPHIPQGVYFIPAHPIAGSEQSGTQAGRADLFEHKRVIVTPEAPEMTDALRQAMRFWQALGAQVEAMPAEAHDVVYAYVSHLPQLLAFSLAAILAPFRDSPSESFQKFTRLGGSSPRLWTDIFILNKNNIISALDRYLDVISHIQSELKTAPEPPAEITDPAAVYTALFPRIAASCLITTVMEAEKKSGFSFARFTGNGFADFTYPATLPPDADIERISGQYQAMASLLNEYTYALGKLQAAILAGDAELLKKALGLLS